MRRTRAVIVATLFGAIFLASASAQKPQRAVLPEGVWEGSIGTQAIRACTVQREWGAFGAYYYSAHLKTISLDQSEGSGAILVEGNADEPKNPRWKLTTTSAQELVGTWSQNSRTLPIRLTRVAGNVGEDGPCGSLLFSQPRLQGVRIASRPVAKNNMRYTRLDLDHGGRFPSLTVTSFAFDVRSPAVQRINAELRRPLDAAAEDGWLACVRMALASNGNDGDLHETLEPRLVTRRWLVVAHQTDSFCGGAHPNASYQPRLFDLQTGSEVDLHSWLSGKAFTREGELEPIIPSFRDHLLADWKHEDKECIQAVRNENHWDIELTRAGLAFIPELPHVVQACADPITVPFDRLGAYWSAAGKTHVDMLRAELGASNRRKEP